MRVTWLGHATVAIEMDGARLLTDPVLAARIGHLRRVVPAPDGIGRPSAVLLSHLHRDHLDLPTLRRIDPHVPVLAPAGSAALLRRAGRAEVVEMLPGDVSVVGSVTVRATAADHDGGRPARGAAAWRSQAVAPLGFVVEGTQSVYFAGDTGLFPGMSGLADGLDMALLPVGGWHPRLGPGHLDAEQAARALLLLRPRVAVPIHWGTYAPLGMSSTSPHLTDQGRLFLAAARRIAPEVTVWVLAPGESAGAPPS
jgi:L-ascorbate metabolism protein UlaG (beta-lactamase superfamily)